MRRLERHVVLFGRMTEAERGMYQEWRTALTAKLGPLNADQLAYVAESVLMGLPVRAARVVALGLRPAA